MCKSNYQQKDRETFKEMGGESMDKISEEKSNKKELSPEQLDEMRWVNMFVDKTNARQLRDLEIGAILESVNKIRINKKRYDKEIRKCAFGSILEEAEYRRKYTVKAINNLTIFIEVLNKIKSNCNGYLKHLDSVLESEKK